MDKIRAKTRDNRNSKIEDGWKDVCIQIYTTLIGFIKNGDHIRTNRNLTRIARLQIQPAMYTHRNSASTHTGTPTGWSLLQTTVITVPAQGSNNWHAQRSFVYCRPRNGVQWSPVWQRQGRAREKIMGDFAESWQCLRDGYVPDERTRTGAANLLLQRNARVWPGWREMMPPRIPATQHRQHDRQHHRQ